MFPLPFPCLLFIIRKQSYTFLWEETAEQASEFKMDLHLPHESGYSGTRHMTAWRNKRCLDLGAGGHAELRPSLCVWVEGTWIMELVMTISGLPASRWVNTSFVDTGGVSITLLSVKRETASAWAMTLKVIALW